jgi:hypothetical protein
MQTLPRFALSSLLEFAALAVFGGAVALVAIAAGA